MGRIVVYGKDAEMNEKRAFDLVQEDGVIYLVTVNRDGHKIRTNAKVIMEMIAVMEKTMHEPQAKQEA